MNKIIFIIMLLWISMNLSSCAEALGQYKQKDKNCGTLEVCHYEHIHHNSRKHYDRHE